MQEGNDLDKIHNLLMEQVVKDLEERKLDAKERAKLLIAILPYKLPKLQQIESKNTTKQITIFGDVGD